MSHSLARRFLTVLSFSSVIAWGLLAAWLYWQLTAEVNALFDAYIAEGAETMAALIRSEALEFEAAATQESGDFDAFIAAELRRHLDLPVYARDHVYQVALGSPPRFLQSSNAPVSRLADATQVGFSERVIGTARWRVFSLHSDGAHGPLQLSVGEPTQVRAQVMTRLAVGLSAPVLSTLLLLLWLLRWGIGWGLRPVAGLARDVEQRSPRDLHPLALQGLPPELMPIAQSLNVLLGRLSVALQIEREFSADAAHELRNPLAGIKTQTEVALRARDVPERDEALRKVVVGVDHMTVVLAQLLRLARLDPAVLHGECVALALHATVNQVFTEFALRAASRAVVLVNDVPTGFVIQANADALTIALRNLIDNGITHGCSPGRVQVSAHQADDDYAEINVDDDGGGIPDGAHVTLLRRFNRLPQSRGGGSGLGLAIVARIAELHRASVVLGRSRLGGLRVTLRWSSRTSAWHKT